MCDKYKVGQVWSYDTRKVDADKDTVVEILKIEEIPTEGTVIHVMVHGLDFEHCKGPHYAPLVKEAIDNSVIELLHTKEKPSNFRKDYFDWKRDYEKGDALVLYNSIKFNIERVLREKESGNYYVLPPQDGTY